MSLVLTKAAAALQRTPEVQHIKFETHKPKLRKSSEPQNRGPAPPAGNIVELDLKKIRHEIVKFGMSGFDAPKKEEARIALAVSLGAKPPKREYKNYKEVIAQRKEEKRKERERKQLLEKEMTRASVPGGKKKKKNNNDVGHLLNIYGKVDKKKIKEREQKNNTSNKERNTRKRKK